MKIAADKKPVKSRGERLSPIWWQGKQWAVTERGIECRDGTYFIAADRLPGTNPSWPIHMAGKTWVDLDDFCTAFLIALLLHGHGGKFERDVVSMPLLACGAAFERRKENKAWAARFEQHMIAKGKWKKGDKIRCCSAADLGGFE